VGATTFPGRWSVGVVVVSLVLVAVGLTAPAAGAVEPARPTPGPPGTCGAAVPGTGVRGSLSIDGGALSPDAVAGVALRFTYGLAYATLGPGNTSVLASGCRIAQGNASTAANGTFVLAPPVPPTACTVANGEELCTSFAGPYGPIDLSVVAPPPLGYSVAISGGAATGFDLAFVYELAAVSIDPAGPTLAVSAGSTTAFRASAWAANGSASDLAVRFAWNESAPAWQLEGSTSAPSVNLTPVGEPAPAVLTVVASAVVNGTSLEPVRATVDVLAVPTEVVAAQTNRTVLDAGRSVGFRLSASGAGGYPYSVTITPGLGVAPVTVACAAGAPAPGPVTVECAANVTYPAAGTAQPEATVTNGDSSARWMFPQLEVDPPPAVTVNPSSPSGYVGASIPIEVVAENGTGAPPFEQACLLAPPSPALCRATAGPSWAFTPVFAASGSYAATASVVDADGENASVGLTIEVVAPLVVGAIVASTANVTADASVQLTANVSGGLLPLRYWWNSSRSPASLLAGELAADGPVTLTFAPNASGAYVVSLTVVDRLGTVVAGTLELAVGPPAATRVVPVGALPAGAVTVGVAVPLAWEAFELSGAPDVSFAAPVELVLDAPTGAPQAWVNASGLGPLPSLGDGRYGVPASAWISGTLAVDLTLASATTVAVVLVGGGLPGPIAPRNLTGTPDDAHLRLFDPVVVSAGARENATRWQVVDRFGNPAPGATVTVELAFGDVRDASVVRALGLAGGGTVVWVNYSAPTAGAGTLTVVDAAGAVLLGPLTIPAAPPSGVMAPAVAALAAAVPAGAVGSAAFAVVRRRRRTRTTEADEEELRGLAEGRARIVDLLGVAGAADLAGLEAAWGPPAPRALADWLASLVADGTVRTTVGVDGHARFCLARARIELPRITVDPELLESSLRRRDAELGAPETDPPD